MTYNVIQYDDGLRPIYQKCIAQARSRIPADVEYMLLTTTSCKARNADYRAVSDVVRVKLASQQPNLVWLDSDVLIKKWIDFTLKPGKVYINDHTASVVIVNGRTDLFKRLYELYDLDDTLSYPGWLQDTIHDNFMSDIEFLPRGYFVHIGMSSAIHAGQNFDNFGHDGFTISRNKETGELQLKVDF